MTAAQQGKLTDSFRIPAPHAIPESGGATMNHYHRLEAYEAQKLAESLDWQEGEGGELRTYYATANGLQYRLCRDIDGEVEFMQVRAAQC